MAPVLLLLAWAGKPGAFLVLVTFAFLTDALDGLIARRLGQVSPFGAKLDSWGDLAIYGTLALGSWWLWPAIIRRERLFVCLTIGSYLVPVAIGFLRYGRMPSHHTWAAKWSAVLMSASAILMFAGVSPWPFRCSAPLFVLAGLEDVLITALLPAWHPNVPTVRHAIEIRRQERAEA